MSRQGVADYLVVFRKPGENPERVTHTNESFPVAVWQRYASPIWATMNGETDEDGFKHIDSVGKDDGDSGGIDQGNTLQAASAREHADERHLCCLQLGVIKRAVEMWSNPNDIVASWFAGIGSEGYQSLKMNRRFVGCELKESYWKQARLNLISAESSKDHELPLDIAPTPLVEELEEA